MKKVFALTVLSGTLITIVALVLSYSPRQLLSASIVFAGIDVYQDLQASENSFTFKAQASPKGIWKIEVDGFQTDLSPGENLNWQLQFSLAHADLGEIEEKIEEIAIVLAARRMCDTDGHYREQSAPFYSTYLTPSGLPIEGYQYLTNNSKIGGPYKTPLDEVLFIKKGEWTYKNDSLSFSTPVNITLIENFPAGLYRIEIAPYALVNENWLPLHMLKTILDGSSWNLEQEFNHYLKSLSPPVRIGRMQNEPRIIWTLFATHHNLGVSGVVAKEDHDHFAISN